MNLIKYAKKLNENIIDMFKYKLNEFYFTNMSFSPRELGDIWNKYHPDTTTSTKVSTKKLNENSKRK